MTQDISLFYFTSLNIEGREIDRIRTKSWLLILFTFDVEIIRVELTNHFIF